MTLNELRYIVAVAQERNFGRAAQKCFVSQPALSVAIQKLEEELGAPLFERGKNEVTVTPVGERIVEQAQKSAGGGRAHPRDRAGRPQPARRHAEARRHLHGRAVPAARPDPRAARARAADAARHRGEPDREPRGGDCKSGRIDAAIIALPFAPPGVVTEFLYEEPFQVVVPRGPQVGASASRSRRTSLPAEHTILLNVGHCFRDQVLDACPELNRADAQVDAHQLARDGAQHGGVGARRLGAAARRADAEVSQPAGGAGAVHAAGAVAARRARLSQELSAAGGDRGDARSRRARAAAWGRRGAGAPLSPSRRFLHSERRG